MFKLIKLAEKEIFYRWLNDVHLKINIIWTRKNLISFILFMN